MQESWFADRLTLYQLRHVHPDWTIVQYAAATQRSRAWVKKWLGRFGSPPHPDRMVCRSRSCARQHPPPRTSERVVARILALRDELAAQFNRVVGAKTIRWYLQQDPTLVGERLPRSPTTIWKILVQHQCILHPPSRSHQPLPRPAPLMEIEIDWTDVATVPGDPDGKIQHAVEAFNWVDCGTSIPVATRVRDDFNAASTIATCAELVQEVGLPPLIRCDRDSRFVGSHRTDDFPSPFLRFWLNLGVEVDLCPPRTPQDKPYVERFNRSYQEECVFKDYPDTVGAAQTSADTFRQWYCHERPHQGTACANRPPAVAFPQLPTLPTVPLTIDADGWLARLDGHAYRRKVNASGKIRIDTVSYTVGQAYRNQDVTVQLDAAERVFVVWWQEQEIKRLPIKRLIGGVVPFVEMVGQLCQLAEREEARLRERRQRKPGRRLRGR